MVAASAFHGLPFKKRYRFHYHDRITELLTRCPDYGIIQRTAWRSDTHHLEYFNARHENGILKTIWLLKLARTKALHI